MKSLKTKIQFALWTVAVFLIVSCSKQEQKSEPSSTAETTEMTEVSDSVTDIMSSSAATYTHKDKQFKRTADIEMEVANVYQSTLKIEKELSELGGYVAKSELSSQVVKDNTYPIDDENSINIKEYSSSNSMQVNIPSENLSTFLLEIGKEIQFLNRRDIEAEDITLDIESVKKSINRNNTSGDKLNNSLSKGGKLNQETEVIDKIQEKQTEADNSSLNLLSLRDQVKYSTVTILLSEENKIKETKVANISGINNQYQTPFFYGVWEALKTGFYYFQQLLMVLITIWPVWLIGFGIYYGYKYMKKRRGILPLK